VVDYFIDLQRNAFMLRRRKPNDILTSRNTNEQLTLFRNVQARLGQRFEEAYDYRGRLMNGQPAPFRCRAGARYLYVDEGGDVVWCSQKRNLFRKPLVQYGTADLIEQFRSRIRPILYFIAAF
jgi:hypothetical protein